MPCSAPITALAPTAWAPALALLLLLVFPLGRPAFAAEPTADETPAETPAHALARIEAGQPLDEALGSLRDAGLPLVFSTGLVGPGLRVESVPSLDAEPHAEPHAEPRAFVEALLRPHGLGLRTGPGGRLLVVALADAAPPRNGNSGKGGEDADDDTLTVTGEPIEVVASRPWILGESPSVLSLDKDDLLALPHVGDDIFRSLALVPGTTSNEASARLSIRGGRDDEVLVRLDGVEILEPYHLKDFNSALGILAPQIIDGVELLTGGFPAQFGDRMSGVLDLVTVRPEWQRRSELGLNLLDLQLSTSGRRTVDDAGSSWLLSARGGSLEIPFRFADQAERPHFWDVFAKLDRRRSPSRRWGGSLLAAGDRLEFAEIGDDELEQFDTRYLNGYGWLDHQEIRSDRLFFDSRLTTSRIERDRLGFETEEESAFELADVRRAHTLTLAQDWHFQWRPHWRLRAGFDVRRLDVDYDYRNDRSTDAPLALVRDGGSRGTTAFDRRFRGHHYSAYLSVQATPVPGLTVEAGLRFDRNTIVDDDHTQSPRLSLRWAAAPRQLWHASYGRYTQSQRLYELQVEDGLFEFASSEEAEYGSVGWERVFGPVDAVRKPLTLRLELYRRHIGNPRPRFENLYEPISKVPELEIDRYRIDPVRSQAEGIELFLGGAAGRRFDWFATLGWSSTIDRLPEPVSDDTEPPLRDVPRPQDQPFSLRFDLAWHAPRGYDLHLAWQSHTGWPTTALDARQVPGPDGEPRIEPMLGPLRGERLPDYHRLDLRLSRTWTLRRGELRAYIEIDNLLERRNVRGYEVGFEPIEGPDIEGSEEVEVVLEPNFWARRVPSFGLRWRF